MRRIVFGLLLFLFALKAEAQPTNVTIGTANAGGGDTLYSAFGKVNANQTYLYGLITNISVGSATDKLSTNAGTSYSQTAIGLSNKVTGGTVFRSIDARFAERLNVKDFGARGDNSTDDTTAIRAAIAAAISGKASVFFPAGIYLVSPDSADAVFNCDAQTDSVSYGSLLIEGVDGANRLNRLDTTPDETYSRGAVIKFTGNMAGKIGIQSGTNVNNFRLRNLTIIGTGFDVTTSVGVRHNATSSKFEMDNVTLQHWGTAVDIGGDYATVGDSHADFNVLRRVFVSYSDTGVKVHNFQACVNELYSCEISARIPIWNAKSAAGVTSSPDVKIFGGFLQPLTEYNGVLISSSVSTATGQTITVGGLTKTVKVRDSSFVLGTNITVASASDIAVGMYCVIESNASATGAARPNNWGVLNIVSAVDTGTGVVTLTGNVDTTALVGKNVWFVTPAIALYGGHFTLYGTRIEATLSEDFEFGPMLAHILEYQSGTVFNDVDVKLYQTGGFNANLPKIVQEPVYSFHGAPLTIKGGSWEVTYPKMQVAAAHGVSERGVTWLVEPLYLDSTGKIADGVRRAQFSQLSGVRTTTPSAAEHRSRVLKAGVDEYQIIGGLLKRPIRNVTTAPTSGVSGEVAVLETSPRQFYSVAQTSSLDAYYDSTAITAGTAAITSGSTIATVTNFTGLYIGRAITIAGAGEASADLTARIVDAEERPDGTKRIHLYTAAGTTVTAGAISAVSATIESPIDSSAIRIPGGAGGAAMLTFIRSGTATNYISQNGGQLSFHEATSGRTLFKGNHSATTNALDILGFAGIESAKVTNGFSVLGAANFNTATVNDDAYDATSWNGSTNVPTKNAIRDKIEALSAGGGLGTADIDTSAELRAIVTDESGTGALLFAGGDIGAGAATTPAANDNDTSIATTAYVQTELADYALTTSLDTSAELRAILTDETGTGAAVFAGGDIGAATATTAAANDNDTSVATTAYVQTELADYPLTTSLDTSAELRSLVTDESGTGALIFAGGDIGAATATTASAGDSDTSVATTAFVQTEIDATQTGSHASPSTSNPLSPTWSGPLHTVWYGATGTINLPAASTYSGRAILIYNTGAFTITIDPNGTEVVVRDGNVQTGGVNFTLSSGAGNYVAIFCDGTRWITLGYKGTLAVGS